MRVQIISTYAKQLQQWENTHSDYLETLEYLEKANSKISLPKEFMDSQELLMHKLKKRKCQLCFYQGGYKFIRKVPLTDTPCMVFLICQSCRLLPKDRLPCQIDHNHYIPMHEFLQRMYSLVNIDARERSQEMVRYRIGEMKLEHTIGQLHKIINRWEADIAKRVRQQIKGFATLYSGKSINKDLLLEEEICDCDDCCYCDYSLEGRTPLKGQCAFRQLKSRQDNFLRQFQLFDKLIHRPSTSLSIDVQMEVINSEVEMAMIKYLQPMEEILQQLIQETKGISLTDDDYLRHLEEKYKFYKTEQEKRREWGDMQMRQSERCWKSGVVNHLTCENYEYFDKNNDVLTLKYVRDTQSLMKNIQKFKNTTHLNLFSSNIMAQLQKIDIQKSFTKLHSVQLNCFTTSNFISKLKGSDSLKLVYLNGNMLDSFQFYHQIEHFPQSKVTKITKNEVGLQLLKSFKGKIGSVYIGQSTLLQPLLLEELEDSPLEGLAISKSIELPPFILTWTGVHKLTSLYLHKIMINENISTLLSNCSNLQAFSLNCCTNIGSDCLKELSNLHQLRKLALIQLSLLPNLPRFRSLTTFILQRLFTSLDGQHSLFEVLEDCRLKHLSLYECIFLDDDSLIDILQKQSEYGELQTLNVGETSITQLSFQSVGKFKLQALHIGGTLVDPFEITKDLRGGKLQNLRGLQRLNLRQLKICQNTTEGEYFNDVFSELLSQFPLLSHLDISYNPLGQRALRFNLQCLTFVKAQQCSFPQPSTRESHFGRNCLFYNGREQLKPKILQGSSSLKIDKKKEQVSRPREETYLHLII